MKSRISPILFTIFAPITIPAYLLVLAATTLFGGAYYIVVEASIAPLVGRPISLSKWLIVIFLLPLPILPLILWVFGVHVATWQFIVLSPLVVQLTLLAMGIHLILFLIRSLVGLLIWIGRWQVGSESRINAGILGTVWTLAALWVTITCLNAAVGMNLIFKGIPQKNRDFFVESLDRPRLLGDLPSDLQARRKEIQADVAQYGVGISPDWRELKDMLQDDNTRVYWLPKAVHRRLAGMPWFFYPKEISEDGLDHSALLLGPLLFAWLVLYRWPGIFGVLRGSGSRHVWFLLRIVLAVVSIYLLVTWTPRTAYIAFFFDHDMPSLTFQFFSPACWFGVDPTRWVRPEWYLFNAALWIIFVLTAVFIWYLAWRMLPFLGWPRYYVPYLASRLLQRKRIAFFSVGAVTLCVAMMIIVISVMGGFVDSIRNRANGLLGDLVFDGYLQGFPYYQEFIDELAKMQDPKTGEPIVVQATPLIHSYGVLQFPKTTKTKAVRIWGIRLNEYVRVNEFGKDLFYQNHYGGTQLEKPIGKPVFGIDPKTGMAVLPGDMDEHYRQFVASLPPDKRVEEEKRYHRDSGGGFPGPGIYDMASPPDFKAGYEEKELPGLIVGRDVLLRRLPSGEYMYDPDYPRGKECSLTLVPITRDGSIPTEPPPKPFFRYIDDVRTGIHEIDSMNVYVDFANLQKLLSMGPQQRADGKGTAGARCSQLQVKVNKKYAAPREVLQQTKALIWDKWRSFASGLKPDTLEARMLEGVGVQTWEEMQQDFISAIEKEKVLVLIMFGVISIVAVFLILCIFYMIVQEKTRDIGIIKSIGGSTGGVAAVFLTYGAAIGLVGCIVGSLIGTTFVEHINEIQDWLARINPSWRVWSPETYSFDLIPNTWKWSEVMAISVLAILASILGAAFPAIRAGRTWPVESLRYE